MDATKIDITQDATKKLIIITYTAMGVDDNAKLRQRPKIWIKSIDVPRQQNCVILVINGHSIAGNITFRHEDINSIEGATSPIDTNQKVLDGITNLYLDA